MRRRNHPRGHRDLAWQDSAACVWQSLTLFYGTPGEDARDKAQREKYAKRICHGCRARRPCLEFALSRRDPYGIWGGLTPAERRPLTRALRNPTTPDPPPQAPD